MFLQIRLYFYIIILGLFFSCIKDEDLDFEKIKKIEFKELNVAFPMGYDTIKINKLLPSVTIIDNDTSRQKITLSFLQSIDVKPQKIEKGEMLSMRYRFKIETFFPSQVIVRFTASDINSVDILDFGVAVIEPSILDDFGEGLKQTFITDFSTDILEKQDIERIVKINMILSSKEFEIRRLKKNMYLKYGISFDGKVNLAI